MHVPERDKTHFTFIVGQYRGHSYHRAATYYAMPPYSVVALAPCATTVQPVTFVTTNLTTKRGRLDGVHPQRSDWYPSASSISLHSRVESSWYRRALAPRAPTSTQRTRPRLASPSRSVLRRSTRDTGQPHHLESEHRFSSRSRSCRNGYDSTGSDLKDQQISRGSV